MSDQSIREKANKRLAYKLAGTAALLLNVSSAFFTLASSAPKENADRYMGATYHFCTFATSPQPVARLAGLAACPFAVSAAPGVFLAGNWPVKQTYASTP